MAAALLLIADHGSFNQSLAAFGPVALMLLFLVGWTLVDLRRRRRRSRR